MKTTLVRNALLAAAALSASPAFAQDMPASVRFAKTEAILGGAPSALEAILSQQKAIVMPTPARTMLQPASYAVQRRALGADRLAIPNASRDAADTGKPDVFGSVALPVRHTALDARWRRASAARLPAAAAAAAGALSDLDPIDRLEAVNRYVNRHVAFVDDRKQFGRADVWSAAANTLSRGRGDCEDYAIAKLQILRRAGFAERDLYLVIVKDLVARADHAVLVVRANHRLLVLDNGTERVMDSSEIRDFRPVLTFSSTGTWTHGYRLQAPATEIATKDIEAEKALAPSADNQRSRSASLLALSTGFNR